MTDQSEASLSGRIGAHEVHVDRDLIRVTFHGVLLPEDAQQITELVDRVGSGQGNRALFIANLKDAGPPGPEARRVFASWRPQCHFFTVYFGAVLQQQTFASLIEATMHTLGGKATRGRFVASEEEALAAVAEERQRIEA